MSIRYPDLNYEARWKIWKMFLEKVSAEINGNDLSDLAQFQMNGRQASLLQMMCSPMATYYLQLIYPEYSKQRTLRCAAERNRTLEGAHPFGTESDSK